MELLLPAWIFVSILIVLALALGVYTLHRYANGPLEHKTIPCNCAQCKAKRAYLTANTGRTLTHVLHALSLTMFVFSVTLAVSLYVGRTRVTDDFDPYSILNVTRTASERTISLSHKRLAKSHSPGTPSESIERAFDILSDRETQECISSFGSVSGLRLPLFGVHIPCDFFRVILIIIGSPIAVGLFALVFFMFTILFISSKKLNETTREVFAHSSSSLYKKYTNDNTRTSEGILAIITASCKNSR